MKKLFLTVGCVIFALACSFSFTACGGDNVGKVSVKYYQDGSSIVAALKAGSEQIGMIPEPAATMLEKQTPDTTWYRLDVQELYDADAKAYPQAVLMVKSSLLNAYPQIVTEIENKISENVAWAKQNPTDAVNAIKGSYDATTLKAQMLSEKSIDGCKIYFQSALDAKSSVNKYIEDIRSIDDKSANTVTDDFFYTPASASATWENENITFYAPDGAPAISIAKFIADGQAFGTGKTVNYNVVKADTIVGQMAQSKADIILLPVNGASKMYKANANANDPYQLVSVITHGNFYIMSKTQLTLNDLVDKKIAVPNMGAVPDWTFQTIIKTNNLQMEIVD